MSIFGADVTSASQTQNFIQAQSPVIDNTASQAIGAVGGFAKLGAEVATNIFEREEKEKVDKFTSDILSQSASFDEAIAQGGSRSLYEGKRSVMLRQAAGGDADRYKSLVEMTSTQSAGVGIKSFKSQAQLQQEQEEKYLVDVNNYGGRPLDPDDADYKIKFENNQKQMELDAFYAQREKDLDREAILAGSDEASIKRLSNKRYVEQDKKIRDYAAPAMKSVTLEVADVVSGKGEWATASKEERYRHLSGLQAQIPQMRAQFPDLKEDQVNNMLVAPLQAEIQLGLDNLSGKTSDTYFKQQNEYSRSQMENQLGQDQEFVAMTVVSSKLGGGSLANLELNNQYDIRDTFAIAGISTDPKTGKLNFNAPTRDTATNSVNTLSPQSQPVTKEAAKLGLNAIAAFNDDNTPPEVRANNKLVADSVLNTFGNDITLNCLAVTDDNLWACKNSMDMIAQDSVGQYIKEHGWPEGVDQEKMADAAATYYVDRVVKVGQDNLASLGKDAEYVKLVNTPTGIRYDLDASYQAKLEAQGAANASGEGKIRYDYQTGMWVTKNDDIDLLKAARSKVETLNRNVAPVINTGLKAFAHMHGEEYSHNTRESLLPAFAGKWQSASKVGEAMEEHGSEAVGKVMADESVSTSVKSIGAGLQPKVLGK